MHRPGREDYIYRQAPRRPAPPLPDRAWQLRRARRGELRRSAKAASPGPPGEGEGGSGSGSGRARLAAGRGHQRCRAARPGPGGCPTFKPRAASFRSVLRSLARLGMGPAPAPGRAGLSVWSGPCASHCRTSSSRLCREPGSVSSSLASPQAAVLPHKGILCPVTEQALVPPPCLRAGAPALERRGSLVPNSDRTAARDSSSSSSSAAGHRMCPWVSSGSFWPISPACGGEVPLGGSSAPKRELLTCCIHFFTRCPTAAESGRLSPALHSEVEAPWLLGSCLESPSDCSLFHQVYMCPCSLCLHVAATTLLAMVGVTQLLLMAVSECWWPCVVSAGSWQTDTVSPCSFNRTISLQSLRVLGRLSHATFPAHAFLLFSDNCSFIHIPRYLYSPFTQTLTKAPFTTLPLGWRQMERRPSSLLKIWGTEWKQAFHNTYFHVRNR